MANEPKKIFLYNNQGTSDKVYNVYLRETAEKIGYGTFRGQSLWEVYAEWGRRGQPSLKGMIKKQGSWKAANWEFEVLVLAKKDRGYTEDVPLEHWELTAAPEEDYQE